MAKGLKYRDIVRELAFENYGYVTTQDAAEAGVPPIELPKLASRGGLDSIAYGVYRVDDVPPTPFDQFAEALLRVGRESYLYGETVLALLGLGDVNPRRIEVATPRRARPRLPDYIRLVRTNAEPRTTCYEGLRAQPVADAIIALRGRMEPERLRHAAREARQKGLLTTGEYRRVNQSLRS